MQNFVHQACSVSYVDQFNQLVLLCRGIGQPALVRAIMQELAEVTAQPFIDHIWEL